MSEGGIEGAVLASFAKYDTDGSGTIDAKEFVALCKDLGADMKPYEAERAVSLLDVDKSGSIDKTEFLNWWLERGGDLDGDGKIDATEAKVANVAHQGFEKACVFYIESLREDRSKLNRALLLIDEERATVQKRIAALEKLLAECNANLARMTADKERLDSVIEEIEKGYVSILGASQSLLHSARNMGSKVLVKTTDIDSAPPRPALERDTPRAPTGALRGESAAASFMPPTAIAAISAPAPAPYYPPVTPESDAHGSALSAAGFAPPGTSPVRADRARPRGDRR